MRFCLLTVNYGGINISIGSAGGCLESIIHSRLFFLKVTFYIVLTPAFHFLNVACL